MSEPRGGGVPSASVEVARVVEGAVGGVLIVVVLTILAVQCLRWWRVRKDSHGDPGVPALARFVDSETTDPVVFGGGAWSARVLQRRDTVTYGYLAVAEEYASADSGGRWCTLTVTLPGRVPFVVVENRAASGRSNVPMEARCRPALDDPPFDATYFVGAADEEEAHRVLGPAARTVLMRAPVQRLMLHDSALQLRTLDGVPFGDATIQWLDSVAERFLSSTPAFVSAVRLPAGLGPRDESAAPLPRGFYGTEDD